MSVLFVNSLVLDIVNTRYFARHVQRDQAGNYLWTDFHLDADFTLNPQATSYQGGRAAFPPILPVRLPGSAPVITDEAIRHHIAQPRKRIVYTSGDVGVPGTVIFSSPPTGVPCDPAGGPVIEAFDITKPHGDKTWAGSIRLKASMNECKPQAQALKPYVLSHVYWRTMTTTEDYFSQVNTVGKVIFDLGQLRRATVYPDDFRREFFHPISNDCRREGIEVIPSPDGGSLEYRFSDREMPFAIGSSAPMTRVEAYHTVWWSRGSFLFGAAAEVGRAGPGAAFGLPGLGMGAPPAVARFGFDVFNAGVRSDMPQYKQTVLVRCWGNKFASRYDMMKKALAHCFARIGAIDAGLAQHDLQVTHETSGKFVEVNYGRTNGPEGMAVGVGVAFGAPIDALAEMTWRSVLNRAYQHKESIETATAAGFPVGALVDGAVGAMGATPEAADFLFHSSSAVANPAPPRSFGSRGTILVRLVHQALKEACASPAAPLNPSVAAPIDFAWG